jgi:hypothetical protein
VRMPASSPREIGPGCGMKGESGMLRHSHAALSRADSNFLTGFGLSMDDAKAIVDGVAM